MNKYILKVSKYIFKYFWDQKTSYLLKIGRYENEHDDSSV